MNFKFFLRLCSHFLVAVIFAFVLASLFHSQFVMAELTQIGVEISLNDRLSMSLDDLLGLCPTYGVVIALSFCIAFIVANLIVKRVSLSPYILYALAGGTGVSIALLAMQPILDITLIAGARSTFGFACQSLAGAIGGGVFTYLRKNSLA
ncbi:hypothetical protein [uncultured Paraglaciecola sp.]|uniref:hypothetical protein n=1 Tax=uncultured Paraglaciecola sp. TaxID=1765024 RepID=UPI00262843C9|nr:hypothetical protein [uncultured Paraglaciecola sp.]